MKLAKSYLPFLELQCNIFWRLKRRRLKRRRLVFMKSTQSHIIGLTYSVLSKNIILTCFSGFEFALPIIPVLKMMEHCKMNWGADSRKASKIPRPRASL